MLKKWQSKSFKMFWRQLPRVHKNSLSSLIKWKSWIIKTKPTTVNTSFSMMNSWRQFCLSLKPLLQRIITISTTTIEPPKSMLTSPSSFLLDQIFPTTSCTKMHLTRKQSVHSLFQIILINRSYKVDSKMKLSKMVWKKTWRMDLVEPPLCLTILRNRFAKWTPMAVENSSSSWVSGDWG